MISLGKCDLLHYVGFSLVIQTIQFCCRINLKKIPPAKCASDGSMADKILTLQPDVTTIQSQAHICLLVITAKMQVSWQ